MGNHCSKCVKYTDASSPTISRQQRPGKSVELQSEQRESESPHLLPSSDSVEKIDVPSASGANSDPPISSTSEDGNKKNYYVFLSFRGPDTRKGFIDHLYQRLKAVGLPFHPNFVFRDDEDLNFGEKIGKNLISAIECSKVSIPVISENYAASKWCLRELIHIMKCKESRGQIVLPVLYKVKTEDVKHMQGKFGEAFESSMGRFDEKVKQQGPLALREAVDLRVFESEKFADGREGELVNELVEKILLEQRHDFQPHLPEKLVAIEDRVAKVMELVDLACPDTRIIGIWGMGGIGKTTLATMIYNKLFDNFHYRSSLKDIRETAKKKGMEHVQSLLISDIRKVAKSTVRDPEMGIDMIRSSCDKKKVLILLDDVDHRDHLDKLIGGCNFGLRSRIIITCRNKALLKPEYKCCELEEMNGKNSMLLFSFHAFGVKQPPTELMNLSKHIVATTGGLPLALQVIGSYLKDKDTSIWIETLEKLRQVPHTDVQEKLKISYDSLGNQERRMFLDIACFFIGIDKRIVTYLWKDLGLYPASGLARLIELSFIKYDYNKELRKHELRMHDQLRDLGRDIARSAGKEFWDWSRLWDEEAMKVLGHKEENENIEAICLDKRGPREFMEQVSFKKVPNLKFLHVNAMGFVGHFEGSLSELRWLKWAGCCDSFEATGVHLEKLVVLDLSGGQCNRNRISENWIGWSSIKMEKLKVLNLSYCSELTSTPNLSAFKNLELLILHGCTDLKEIDPSIGDVKRLTFLNLSYCGNLKMLPKQLGELENLEELVVDATPIKEIPPCIGSLKQLKRLSARRCWQLTEVLNSVASRLSLSLGDYNKLPPISSSIGKLGELLELDLSITNIEELPESIGELKKLKILRIYISKLKRLPSSIGKLQSLQKLSAYRTESLEGEIHVDKGGWSSLKTLDLNHTNISGLPENLDQLSSLEHLDLIGCFKLESLPKPPFNLLSLRLTCRSNELPSLSHLNHLQELDLQVCKSLQCIPSLSHLKCLQELALHDCESIESIPELPSCIRRLDISTFPKLERLPNLSHLEFLWQLHIPNCNGLKKLDGLEALKSLRELHLWLYGEKVDHLHAIEGLEKLESLEEVEIFGRKHIQVLDLSKSEHLKRLNVRDCKSLVEIRCPSKFLKHFDRRGCESLEKLPDFLPPDGLWSDLDEEFD